MHETIRWETTCAGDRAHVIVCADVAQQQTVRKLFWAHLPSNLIREKLLVTVCTLVGYSYRKPRSLMYEGIYQLSLVECSWSPSLLTSKQASWLLQWHQSVYSFPKTYVDCLITNCQERGSVLVCLLQQFAAMGWPVLPTPRLLQWMLGQFI